MQDVWERIRKNGDGWYWIAPRLRAGDVYHLCSFAAAFKETHGDAPIFLVVSSRHQANMTAVFDDHIAKVIVEPSLSEEKWLQLALQIGAPPFAKNAPLLLDPWANREIDPGAVSRFARNGVLWTQFYKLLLRIPLTAEPTAPAVKRERVDEARALCEAAGMQPGRSVLLFPYAQTFSADVGRHFAKLAETLSGDYQVYTSVADGEAPVAGTQPVFVPFALLPDVAEFAGWAVILRSGIADILASARCRKTVVYRDHEALQNWSLLQLDLARDASEFAFAFGAERPEAFVEAVLASRTPGREVFRTEGLPGRLSGRRVSIDELGALSCDATETLIVQHVPYRGHPRLDATDRLRRLLDWAGPDRRLYACRDSAMLDAAQWSFPFWEEIDAEMLLSGRYDAASYWHNIALTETTPEPCLPLTALHGGVLEMADPAADPARARSSVMGAPFGYKGVSLLRGWYPAETWGAWGEGPYSRIRLVLQNTPSDGFVLTLAANLVMSERCPELRFSIAVNGSPIGAHLAVLDGPREFETFVPPSVVMGRIFEVDIRIENFMTPEQQGQADPRPLGFGLRSLRVEPPRPLKGALTPRVSEAPTNASLQEAGSPGPGAALPPRVCACIILNHPYPENLPILRKLYAGRFSRVVFLIPFLQSPDEDVITVYRGPYFHAGFLTDARERLAQVDCDYFLVLHDDILLNPRIDEDTFREYFPLGPNDGFFPRVWSLPQRLRDWSWYAGMIPRLLHPKSFVFGSGIEAGTLAAYLPDPALTREKLQGSGAHPVEEIDLRGEGGYDLTEGAARFLLYGVGGRVPVESPEYAPVREGSERAVDHLLAVMDRAAGLARPEPEATSDAPLTPLPVPLVNGGVFTDIYVLPKSRLAEFAHHVGVATAADLWTEVMAPSILYSVCDRVWSAEELGLRLDAYNSDASILRMLDARTLMSHPFKLSTVQGEEAADRLLNWIGAIRADGAHADLGPISFGYTAGLATAWSKGWHGEELWGRWSAETEATIGVWCPAERPLRGVRVRLRSPANPEIDPFTGSVRLNDGSEHPVSVPWGGPADVDVMLPGELIRPGEMNVITVTSLTRFRPCDLDPSSGDARTLGFGAVEIELL